MRLRFLSLLSAVAGTPASYLVEDAERLVVRLKKTPETVSLRSICDPPGATLLSSLAPQLAAYLRDYCEGAERELSHLEKWTLQFTCAVKNAMDKLQSAPDVNSAVLRTFETRAASGLIKRL